MVDLCTVSEWKKYENKVRFYIELKQTIGNKSGDFLDLKAYEPDMRKLIGNYIIAGDSIKIGEFDDLTLLDFVNDQGNTMTANSSTSGQKQSAAEAIENNIRRKMVERITVKPKYYEKMSAILEKLIEERKQGVASYKELLEKYIKLAKNVDSQEENEAYPESIQKSRALQSLYDNVGEDEELALKFLKDDDVETFSVAGTDDVIMVIWVPSAKREQKPVYINDGLFGGTFRRNWEGDYHCTRLQIKTMLRDQADETMDMEVLEEAEIKDLNQDSIRGYRNSHKSFKPGHPFERLDDKEYLRVIGAAGFSKNDKKLHPTAAGMLMFGNEYDIVRYFPEYFLDYRENPDTVIRWTDRLQSSSGEWSGNVFDFYFRVYNKITKDIKVPFRMEGGFRVDDTPVHRALREALANCMINTDFYGKYGVLIVKEEDKIVFENPGYIRLGKEQMRRGGKSDPRNKSLMKMFNLIDIGEHAGSGVPNIFNVWEDEEWEEPDIKESFDPDRTSLILKFVKKQAIKTSDKKQAIKTSDKKQAIKTKNNQKKIQLYLQENETAKTREIADLLGLSMARTREILSMMDEVEAMGRNKTRIYRLRKDFSKRNGS